MYLSLNHLRDSTSNEKQFALLFPITCLRYRVSNASGQRRRPPWCIWHFVKWSKVTAIPHTIAALALDPNPQSFHLQKPNPNLRNWKETNTTLTRNHRDRKRESTSTCRPTIQHHQHCFKKINPNLNNWNIHTQVLNPPLIRNQT